MRRTHPLYALLAALLCLLMVTPAFAAPAAQGPPGQQGPPGEGLGQAKKPVTLPVTGTVPNGTFEGTLSELALSRGTGRALLLSGVLTGQATMAGQTRRVEQKFANVPVALSNTPGVGSGGPTTAAAESADDAPVVMPIVALNAPAAQAACDILFLDIQPIFLDLLGLTVDLSRVTLDVNAVPGAGNLLGNLLCAVVGLLDPDNGLDLGGLLGSILTNLLDAINDILDGLFG
jgi:hypothetical protein